MASGCRTGQQRSSIWSSPLWGRTPAAGVSVGVGREQADTERSTVELSAFCSFYLRFKNITTPGLPDLQPQEHTIYSDNLVNKLSENKPPLNTMVA